MSNSDNPAFGLHSRRVVTPAGLRDATIMVSHGTIVGVEERSVTTTAISVHDVGDLVILPGLVDPHVHINEPGRADWEGFETATRAALAGGITTLVDMPLNSSPVTTSMTSFGVKLAAAAGKLHVDCGFHAGLVPANAHTLRPLLEGGVLAVKAFLADSGIDEFPAVTESDLRAAMGEIAASGLPLLVHAELHPGQGSPAPTTDKAQPDPQKYANYLASRPRQWENDAVALMIRLSKEFGCRVHIVHLSSSEAVPLLREAKEAGLPVTVETCPHYLAFVEEDIPVGDTRFKCAPPIRERENNEKLWDALKEGVIDFIVSDHSPCPPGMKLPGSGDFMKAWGGIASLQFGLPVMWTEAKKRKLPVTHISRWMAANTASFLGLERKGTIAPGYDADLVVWDPDEWFIVEPSMIHHRHKVTPYEGRKIQGKVHMTYLRGKKVFENGTFSSPSGQILLKSVVH